MLPIFLTTENSRKFKSGINFPKGVTSVPRCVFLLHIISSEEIEKQKVNLECILFVEVFSPRWLSPAEPVPALIAVVHIVFEGGRLLRIE